jgi:hypothetical protein
VMALSTPGEKTFGSKMKYDKTDMMIIAKMSVSTVSVDKNNTI